MADLTGAARRHTLSSMYITLAVFVPFSGGSTLDYENMVYMKFYTRAAPYLVGMAVGYYLARRDLLKEKVFKVSCT